MAEGKAKVVKSVDRALSIMEEIAKCETELGVTELGNKLSLHKSTVHRLLSTLQTKGYVQKSTETGGYRPGNKIIELGSSIFNDMNIRKQARPYLQELMEETNETVHLVIRDGSEGVYIDKVESSQMIRMHSEVGRRIPLHCSSVGKVLLSGLKENKLNQMYKNKQLQAYTENTITNLKELKKELALIKERGYAVDKEEYEEQVHCIAAPIKNYRGEITAAVSISGPLFRLNKNKKEKFIKKIKVSALKISQKLGYVSN